MTKPLATFHEGTLRESLLKYSQNRCDRDPRYRRDVRKALAEKRRRKAEAAAKEAAEKNGNDTGTRSQAA